LYSHIARTRLRWLGLAGLVAAVAAIAPPITPSAQAGVEQTPGVRAAPVIDPSGLDYARLRITLTGNSHWAMATFTGLEFIDTVQQSGPVVSLSGAGNNVISFVPGTGGPVTAVLDAVVSSPRGANLAVTTAKGSVGTFTLDIDGLPASGRVDAFSVTNTKVGVGWYNEQVDGIPRDALLRGAVDLGPIDDERLVMTVVHPWWHGYEWPYFGPDDPTGTWESDNRAHVTQAVTDMVGAGIDVAVYSYGWADYETDPKIDLLIEAANANGNLRLAPMIEMTASSANVQAVIATVRSAVRDARRNPHTYLWREGKPVVFFYADWMLNAAGWNSLIDGLAAANAAVFPVSHVEDPARRTSAQWNYMGPTGWNEYWYSVDARARTFRMRIQPLLRPSLRQTVVVGTVWPGYDDTLIRSPGQRDDRQGGEFYNTRWRAVLRGAPDWVMITSWNEWWEQTHISPSVINGRSTLDQTAVWAAEFHALP
jgi:hypothetical protein